MLKSLILLSLVFGAGEILAARASSRNLKSLLHKDVEGQTSDNQDIDIADGGHIQQSVEKITFLGPKNGWGFVSKVSPYYSADKLTGLRKTRAYDKLREFKYRQTGLTVELNEAAQSYRSWKKNNPVDISKLRDNQLDELNRELEVAKNKIGNLIPNEEY